MLRRAVLILTLLAATWLGKRAARAAPAAPTETVTVTGNKTAPDDVVNHFVQAFMAPSYLTGKVARWETAICPVTVGLAPKFASFVSQRVRDIAARTGAPVNKDARCRPNIEIVFTTTPQSLADGILKQHASYLGYHQSSSSGAALAAVRHPIQAWYLTATKDLDGDVEVDSSSTIPTETVTSLLADLAGGGSGKGHAGVRQVTGGRLRDGARSIFQHVIIAANPAMLTDYEVGSLADYIAMLSLTQLNSLDVCQALPSIINLLAPNCESSPNAISDGDIGYLNGLYKMSADANLRTQQDDIAYQVKQTMAGK